MHFLARLCLLKSLTFLISFCIILYHCIVDGSLRLLCFKMMHLKIKASKLTTGPPKYFMTMPVLVTKKFGKP